MRTDCQRPLLRHSADSPTPVFSHPNRLRAKVPYIDVAPTTSAFTPTGSPTQRITPPLGPRPFDFAQGDSGTYKTPSQQHTPSPLTAIRYAHHA